MSTTPEKTPTERLAIEQQLADQWKWFLYVLFGGIGTLAFRRLEEGLWAASDVSSTQFWHHIFLAVCLFAFFVYDVGVLGVLIHRFPYKVSLLSALRYALDIVMAFLIFLLLMSGLGPPPAANASPGLAAGPTQSPVLVVFAISAWHLGAAIWHTMASFDHHHATPRLISFLPHIIFAAVYWLIYGISYWGWINFTPMWLLSLIGAAILVISVIRWFQVVKNM